MKGKSKKLGKFPQDIGAARVAEGDKMKGFKKPGKGASKIK